MIRPREEDKYCTVKTRAQQYQGNNTALQATRQGLLVITQFFYVRSPKCHQKRDQRQSYRSETGMSPPLFPFRRFITGKDCFRSPIDRARSTSVKSDDGERGVTRVAPREDRRVKCQVNHRPCAASSVLSRKGGGKVAIYISTSTISPHSTSQDISYLLSSHPRSTRNTQSWVPPLPNPQLPSRPTPLLPSSTTRSGRPSHKSRSTTRSKMIVRLRGRPRWG